MAAPDQIADLVSAAMKGPQGPDDSGFHTGIVRSWNVLTGANVIEVNGVLLPNLRTLRTGIGVSYAAGETVVILRKQTQYFIMGRVNAPDRGGSSGIQSLTAHNTQNIGNTSGAYVTPLSSVTLQSYLGASATALVFMTARISLYTYTACGVHMRMTLSNGTVLPPGSITSAGDVLGFTGSSASSAESIDTSILAVYLATPADGFVSGLTTFKTECFVEDGSSPPTGVDFHSTGITIVPL